MPKTTDDADLQTFVDFVESFGHGDGELGRDLTQALAKAVRATNAHGGKSRFTLTVTVEQVDETLWGELLIVPAITEKPARPHRAGHYRTDPESGQLALL